MSQELVPVANREGTIGLTPTIVTTTVQGRAKEISETYKRVRNLWASPTQWVPGGRPIYRRLPAASETYQIDFFSDGEIGFCYIPYGDDQFGAGSIRVDISEDLRTLLIYDGVIVWKEGTTPVLKAIINLEEVGILSGRFLVAYQQFYDDAPQPLPFEVTDFSLAGQDFAVEDSASYNFQSTTTANGNAWPYPGSYAFMPSGSDLSWKNYLEPVNRVPQANSGVVPGVPEEYQPILAWISWKSPLPWKLDKITLRTPSVVKPPAATLYYFENGGWKLIQTAEPLSDTNGYYWQFITNSDPQTAWKVEWPDYTKVEVNDITVSGILNLYSKPSTERARAQLAIYPTNAIPKEETFCRLAIINVNNFEIQRNDRGELLVEDIRDIATRDYEPVADWLTLYWDRSLIHLEEKVATYSPGFMAPPTLLQTSYFDLEPYGIEIYAGPPPYPASLPEATEVNLLGATVSLFPPLPEATSLVEASVSFFSDPSTPQITDITISVEP